MITPEALIEKFRYALINVWGYIYGMLHVMWTEARQKSYTAQYNSDPVKYASHKNSVEYGSKWYGHWVTDCSGLFAWAFSELGGKIAHGSNSIWRNYCSTKGTLANGIRNDGQVLKPGTAVFTGNASNKGHIGLYVGDGTVIEAQGTKAGVTTSKVTDSRWKYWGELKDVAYEGGDEPVPEKGKAIVTGNRVALREGPSTSAKVLTRVETGKTVTIRDEPEGWEYVEYSGKTGYMMNEYLRKGE